MTTTPISVIVLAAGKGTRMKSNKPKVMHCIAGAPMLWHVINATREVNIVDTVIVTGHGGESVRSYISETFPDANCIIQEEQLGTGHAVLQAQEVLSDFKGDVIILNGDVPLIDEKLIEQFIYSHQQQENDVTAVTAYIEDPTGLGRILRDNSEDIIGIIEHKDATDEQKKIDEINVGFYIVKAPQLFSMLGQVDNDNANGEYYITDLIKLALKENLRVGTFTAPDAEALGGVNSRFQLSCSEDYFQNRRREELMDGGVTMIDPQSVFVSFDTKISKDVHLGPFIQIGSGVTIESGVNIEGNCVIKNSYINENSTILSYCHIDGARIGTDADVGPFARLRPETDLMDNSKVGNFVEIKKSKVGNGSKVNHLSYVGNTQIGDNVNFGAGSITANYYHPTKEKHETIIKDNAAIGASNVLVAPVTIGEQAVTGANATITQDVPDRALAFSKSERIVKENYISKESE